MKILWNSILLAGFACTVFPMAIILSIKWCYRGLRSGWTLDEITTEWEHEFDEKSVSITKRFEKLEL